VRRPRTTFSNAVVAIALSAATGLQAQQPSTTATGGSQGPSQGPISVSARNRAQAATPAAPPNGPMLSSRGARQLLRNGEDFLNYAQYDRALDFLREAEAKQFELTAQERNKLHVAILRAKRGLRGMDDGAVVAAKGRAPVRRSAVAANRPGAIVLDVPQSAEPLIDDPETIQLTSATQEEPAPASPAARGPVASLPELPPLDSVAPSQAPEPLSAPAEFTPPPGSLSETPPPIITPPDLTDGERPEPPALSEMVRPASATSADAPLSDPLPNIAPVELVEVESEDAPALEEQPQAAPAPIDTELPPPLLLEEETGEEAAPLAKPAVVKPIAAARPPVVNEAQAPAAKPDPTAARPSKKTAAKPTVAAPASLPPVAVAEPPAPAAEAPVVAPTEDLTLREVVEAPAPAPAPAPAVEIPQPEPVLRTAQAAPEIEAEPAPAPAPVPIAEAETEVIEPAPPPEASAVEMPPLPETPAASPPPSIAPKEAGDHSLSDRATAVISDHKRPSLSEDAKRRIEQIARRQQDDAARNPVPPLSAAFGGNPGTMTTDDLTSNRLELPRAPSPTEIRPIRAIPIPEEFVPLAPRQWTPSRKAWTAAATGHGPLYFQDAVLERYGQSVEHAIGSKGRFLSYPLDDPRESNQRNQILQPFFSIGLFASQVALLPYNMIVDPPWEGEYDLGYYRPGDRVPPDTIYLPLSGVGPPLRGRHY
jgi:hypothetical protein